MTQAREFIPVQAGYLEDQAQQMMPMILRMFEELSNSRGISIQDLRDNSPIHKQIRHFLDPVPGGGRPTVANLVNAIKARHDWSNGDLAKKMRCNANHVQRMSSGGQKGCYPETQAKFRKLVEGDAELALIYYRVDWGEAAKERKR